MAVYVAQNMCYPSPYLHTTVLSCFGHSSNDIVQRLFTLAVSAFRQNHSVGNGQQFVFWLPFAHAWKLPTVVHVPTGSYSPRSPLLLPSLLWCSQCPDVNVCTSTSVCKPQAPSPPVPSHQWHCSFVVHAQCCSFSQVVLSRRQTSVKKLRLHFKNRASSLREAGKWGLKLQVAEILTSGPSTPPRLYLPILKCCLSWHTTIATSLRLPKQLADQSRSEWDRINLKHSCR